jgi:hypothetical protein
LLVCWRWERINLQTIDKSRKIRYSFQVRTAHQAQRSMGRTMTYRIRQIIVNRQGDIQILNVLFVNVSLQELTPLGFSLTHHSVYVPGPF